MYEELIESGLTRNESKIYATLVDQGKAQAGTLSRKTGIHRRSVYDSLERLIEKGLVSFIKENNKRYYLPSDPKQIKAILEYKQEQVYKILPELEAKFNMIQQKQETLFYRGVQGIKTILEDQINVGKDIFVMGGSRDALQIVKFYLRHYTMKRIKKNILLHIIYAGKHEKAKRIPFSKIKFLPESFASPVATNIYGDNVAIIIWSFEPVAILIKNKEIAKTYKKYFDLLWKTAKRTPS